MLLAVRTAITARLPVIELHPERSIQPEPVSDLCVLGYRLLVVLAKCWCQHYGGLSTMQPEGRGNDSLSNYY